MEEKNEVIESLLLKWSWVRCGQKQNLKKNIAMLKRKDYNLSLFGKTQRSYIMACTPSIILQMTLGKVTFIQWIQKSDDHLTSLNSDGSYNNYQCIFIKYHTKCLAPFWRQSKQTTLENLNW